MPGSFKTRSATFAALYGVLATGRAVGAAEPVIEEVIVTAQKRAENAQGVPVAVSVVSGATLQQIDALSITDLGALIPTVRDDWNKLDIPGLRGLRHTAPYFHNNSANTLEEVVDHYIEFFKRVKINAAPGVVPPIASTDGVNFDRAPKPEERAALLAYLRKL